MVEQTISYSTQELVKQIEELGAEEPWFHCIDLGNGITTTKEPIQHMQDLWAVIDKRIPQDLSGMRVLDIGCNAGFFSVAAKKRNAAYVLGIDTSAGYLKQAEFVSSVLNLEIDYRKLSVYELPLLRGSFDLVFCLGVIYHCADPFLVARNVFSVTGKTAVIESALMDSSELRTRPLWEYVFPGYVADEDERRYNWWFPNMSGLKSLFQSAGFRSVEPVHEANNRGAVICHK